MDDVSAAQCTDYDDDVLDDLVQITDECREIDSDFFNFSDDDDEIVMDSGRLVPTTAQPQCDESLSSSPYTRGADGADHALPKFPYANKENVSKCSIKHTMPSANYDPAKSSASSVSSYQGCALQTNQLVPLTTWSDLPCPGGWGHQDRQGSHHHQVCQEPSRSRVDAPCADRACLGISQTPSFSAAQQTTGKTVSQTRKPLSVKQKIPDHDYCDHSAAAFFTAGPVK